MALQLGLIWATTPSALDAEPGNKFVQCHVGTIRLIPSRQQRSNVEIDGRPDGGSQPPIRWAETAQR
jgi:hypothetical protein